MTRAEVERYIRAVTWDANGALEQTAVIGRYSHARNNGAISIGDVGLLDKVFEQVLGVTRDEWFRLLASTDTERLRLLHMLWSKTTSVASVPPERKPTTTGAASPSTATVYPTAGWLGKYLHRYATFMESPDSFIFWSGVSALAATIRRKLHVTFGNYKIVPNFYIVFVSKPGMARKGPPIKAAQLLTQTINDINFIDRTSSERLPHDLCYRQVTIGSNTQKVNADAHGFICSEELVTILDDESFTKNIFKFLLDYWDSPEKRDYKTFKHNVVPLRNVCINLLGGTTPDMLQTSMSHILAGGGMLSRIIFVSEERTAKMISWPKPPDKDVEKELISELAYINSLQGEFALSSDFLAWNDQWYKRFRAKLESDDELAKAIERRQMYIIRLAMILAASENLPLEITPHLCEQADTLLSEMETKTVATTKTLSANTLGREQIRFMDIIKKAKDKKGIMRSELSSKLSPYGIDKGKLNDLIETFKERDEIVEDFDRSSGRMVTWYRAK